MRSTVYSRWFGWSIIIPSTLLVLLGFAMTYRGNTPTKELAFSILATLTLVWALVLGISMLRRQMSAR